MTDSKPKEFRHDAVFEQSIKDSGDPPVVAAGADVEVSWNLHPAQRKFMERDPDQDVVAYGGARSGGRRYGSDVASEALLEIGALREHRNRVCEHIANRPHVLQDDGSTKEMPATEQDYEMLGQLDRLVKDCEAATGMPIPTLGVTDPELAKREDVKTYMDEVNRKVQENLAKPMTATEVLKRQRAHVQLNWPNTAKMDDGEETITPDALVIDSGRIILNVRGKHRANAVRAGLRKIADMLPDNDARADQLIDMCDKADEED